MSATAFILFLIIVALTLVITYFAARQTKTASEFYTAGGGLPVFKTDWPSPGTTCRPLLFSALRA